MWMTRPRSRCGELGAPLTRPGVNSPYRDRTVEENLDLFKRMRDGSS